MPDVAVLGDGQGLDDRAGGVEDGNRVARGGGGLRMSTERGDRGADRGGEGLQKRCGKRDTAGQANGSTKAWTASQILCRRTKDRRHPDGAHPDTQEQPDSRRLPPPTGACWRPPAPTGACRRRARRQRRALPSSPTEEPGATAYPTQRPIQPSRQRAAARARRWPPAAERGLPAVAEVGAAARWCRNKRRPSRRTRRPWQQDHSRMTGRRPEI